MPHFDYDKGLIEGAFIDKCTMCPQRIDVGLEPACVATCPTDALEYGERADLLQKAHARIQAHPDRYIDHVYGETENGGTSYLILSHVPFAELGLPDVGSIPVRDVSEKAMALSLPVGLGWGVVLTGLAAGVHLVNQKKAANCQNHGRDRREAGGCPMKMKIALDPRLRLSPFVLVLLAFAGIAFVVAMIRFSAGIGAISNLNNAYPWGFWVSFDLYTGIAISSGAFVITALVYILELEQFRPLIRPTLLTGFLGYAMEVVALLIDLGHPERIWHYFIYQNFNSFLLVIGLYVMLYATIMLVEFAPAFLDKIRLGKFTVLIKRFMKPLVILGAVISTLHQGSLGALLLIQPARLHPLWWTPILPILFFISAVSIGLGMIIFESSLSSRYFKRGLEVHLLEKLAGYIPFVLALYLVTRLVQLILAGKCSISFPPD